MLLEKLLPFVNNKRISDLIAKIQHVNENDINEVISVMPMLTSFFPFRVKCKGKEVIIGLKQVDRICSTLEHEKKYLLYSEGNSIKYIDIDNILSIDILDSPILVDKKEELLKFFDENYIDKSLLDSIWDSRNSYTETESVYYHTGKDKQGLDRVINLHDDEKNFLVYDVSKRIKILKLKDTRALFILIFRSSFLFSFVVLNRDFSIGIDLCKWSKGALTNKMIRRMILNK